MVPVVDSDQKPLMPCTERRARRMIQSKKATPFFKHGIFCIRLNVEPSARNVQPIAVGIDPGSKKEGFTVKSKARTLLNIQADAVTWVKDAVETRRNMRRTRRYRKTPCRQPRSNRAKGSLVPSTKARWQWKLRISSWLKKLYPIQTFVVEDIKAKTIERARKWNVRFSPLEVGKRWFYSELEKLGQVILKQGYETKALRDDLSLKKTSKKMAEVFEAHCVDSWVLANQAVGGHIAPENKRLVLVTPLQFHRRQLHVLQPAKSGIRRDYGGTRSCGFKRGSLVKHPKYGLSYVGGTMGGKISLHSIETGKRLCQNAKPKDIEFKSYNTWRTRSSASTRLAVSALRTQ